MQFSERELGVISNALRVAAERFREHEKEKDLGSLADHFGLQAKEAEKLYEKIMDLEGVAN